MPYTVSQVTLSQGSCEHTCTHGPDDVCTSTASVYKACPKSVHVCINRLIHMYMQSSYAYNSVTIATVTYVHTYVHTYSA